MNKKHFDESVVAQQTDERLTASKKLIACDIHDYFEAACVYHYQLKITLIGGLQITGEAQTIVTQHQSEFLILQTVQGTQQFDLSEIKNVNVLTSNAKFVEFKLD